MTTTKMTNATTTLVPQAITTPFRHGFVASGSRLLTVAGCAALAVSLAHAGGDPQASAGANHDAKATKVIAKNNAGTAKTQWVAAANAKANGSGIALRYRVPANLQPGQPADIELEFSGVTAADAAAQWRAPAGSAMTAAQGSTATSTTLPPGQTTTVRLTITPSADGMAYVDVFTSQNGRTSAQSVPLKVGTGQVVLKREGSAMTTPSGERVISLPSQPK